MQKRTKRGTKTKAPTRTKRFDAAEPKIEHEKFVPSVDFITMIAAEIMRSGASPNASFVRAASLWNACLDEIDTRKSDNLTLGLNSVEELALVASKLIRPKETARSAAKRALELREICSAGLSGSPIAGQLIEAADSKEKIPFRKFLNICYPTGKHDDQVRKWRDFQRKCADTKKRVDWESLNKEEETAIGDNQPYGKLLPELGPDDFARVDRIISEQLKDDREAGIDLAFSLMIGQTFVKFLEECTRANYQAKGDKGQRAKKLNKVAKKLLDGEDLSPEEVRLLNDAAEADIVKLTAKHGSRPKEKNKLRSAIQHYRQDISTRKRTGG